MARKKTSGPKEKQQTLKKQIGVITVKRIVKGHQQKIREQRLFDRDYTNNNSMMHKEDNTDGEDTNDDRGHADADEDV